MKKWTLLLCVAVYALPLVGQGVASSSIRVSTAVEAPESNIDLLKKSIQSSGSPIATVGKPAKKKNKPEPAKQEEKPQPAQPAQTTQAQPVQTGQAAVTEQVPASPPAPAAQPAQPATSRSKQPVAHQPKAPAAQPEKAPVSAAKPAPKPAASAAATLDMPLEMDGTVQTVQTAVKPVKKAPKSKVKQQKNQPTPAAKQPAAVEQKIEQDNALRPESAAEKAAADTSADALNEEEAAADAELEYAVKMLEQSKARAEAAGRKIPPPAAKNRPNKVPSPNKQFNPNAFRPGVEWIASKSTHFDIYTQKRTAGVPSSNMAMNFEASYQTLRRFIPWMMAGRVRVFVYQDHDSYLRYEPNAKAWTRAVAYPTRGEIVVYDEPGKTRELKEVFTHELTHIFTQQFFDSHQTGRIMTPLWLDEGLAVFMEDQAHNAQGGAWAQDFKTLNFQRDPSAKPAFVSQSMFGPSTGKKLSAARQGKPLYFVPFDKFMEENSLQNAEGANRVQDWYFQAYTMVRFLLNPAGGVSPSNRMQFEQFTRLIAQGEAVRNPSTGFLMKDSRGKTVYEPYSVEKALGRAYRYNSIENFEDAFWRWGK